MTSKKASKDLATSDLAMDLATAVQGEVDFGAGARALYSTDASNYRQIPLGVVCPATVEDAVAAVAVCREHGAPVLSRGGGTAMAGQATNTAVILDWSRHLNGVVDLDPIGRTARGAARLCARYLAATGSTSRTSVRARPGHA